MGHGDEDGRQTPAKIASKNNGGDEGGGLGKGGQIKNGGKRGKRGKHALNENNASPASISFSTSPAHSPEVVDGPWKPVRSVATELNDPEKLKSYEKDQGSVSFVTGVDHGNGGSLDRILHDGSIVNCIRGFGGDNYKDHKITSNGDGNVDEVPGSLDGIYESLDEAVESSDDLAASTRGIKSPHVSQRGREHGSPFIAQSDPGSFDSPKTTGSPKSPEEGEWGTDCGSSDWSAFDTGTYDPGASGAENKEAAIKNDLEDDHAISDSPTLGTGPAAQGLGLPGLGQLIGSKSPISPNPTVNTITTTSTSTWAERNLHAPFLPESLWLHGNSPENKPIDEHRGFTPKEPVSVFEDESSDDEVRNATFHIAIRKRFARPRIVGRGSSSVVVGLKEMLRTTGPERPKKKPGQPQEKLAKLTGDKNWFFQRSAARRAGVVGLPAAEASDRPPLPRGTNDGMKSPVGLKIQPEPVRNLPDGLRSHPIRRAATVPTRKRVSFPQPPTLDIRPEHRSLRQTIVSTPYPTHFTTAGEDSGPDINNRREAMLTVVIYNFQTRVPLTKKLVIPGSRGLPLEDSSHEKKPKIMATLRINFDDEKLVKLIKKEYGGMRGIFRSILSARNVQDVKIFSYSTTSDLIDKIDSTYSNPFVTPENRDLGEAQMLALYRKPRFGRQKHAWLEWIARRPENSTRHASGRQNLALQLVEGWCVWKIASTLLTLLALSAVATLLWIFLGIGDDSLTLPNMNATSDPEQSTEVENIQGSSLGFRGAGGRVQTGVLLGTLVLMLGWTGTGAWILLSWLI